MPLPLIGAGVEELFRKTHLAVTTDEGSLEAGGPQQPFASGDDTKRAPKRDRVRFSFERLRADVFVRDRSFARASRRLADDDGSGFGCRLHPRRRVHQVAGDHPLTLGADRHGRFSGRNGCTRAQPRRADLRAER